MRGRDIQCNTNVLIISYLSQGREQRGCLRKQLLCKNCNIHPSKGMGSCKALSNPHHLCETYVREMRRGGKRRRERPLGRSDDQD